MKHDVATKEQIAELADAIRTAFRRAGGLPLLLRAPDGQQKICEIAAREALCGSRKVRLAMWQPIETAPKDRHFLAWARLVCDEIGEDGRVIAKDKVEHYAVVAYYAFGGIVEYPWRGGVPSNVTFTHWMPLPAGPAQ